MGQTEPSSARYPYLTANIKRHRALLPRVDFGDYVSAMSIFAIIPLGGNSELDKAVLMQFAPPHSLMLPGGAWLVAGQGTAQDVSNRIGITDGHVGSAVVVEASSYYGRASPDVWSWVKNNWEASAVG